MQTFLILFSFTFLSCLAQDKHDLFGQNELLEEEEEEEKQKKEVINPDFFSILSAGAVLGAGGLYSIQQVSTRDKKAVQKLSKEKKESEKISRFEKNWNSWKTTLENSGYNEEEKNFHRKKEIVNYYQENKKIESNELKKRLQEKKSFLLNNSLPSTRKAFKKKILELDKKIEKQKSMPLLRKKEVVLNSFLEEIVFFEKNLSVNLEKEKEGPQKELVELQKDISLQKAYLKMLNKEKELTKEFSCNICLENTPGQRVSTVCHHNFHLGCILEWLNENPSCPNCRRVVDRNALRIFKDLNNKR